MKLDIRVAGMVKNMYIKFQLQQRDIQLTNQKMIN
jgi:hypothetical protein